MNFFDHPPSEIEWVSVALDSTASPVQVKATSTPCRGLIIGRKSGSASPELLMGENGNQPVSRSNLSLGAASNISYVPIDDASKVWLDLDIGAGNVGIGIVK